MEGSYGRHGPGETQPTRSAGGIASVSRFAVLGLAMLIPGDGPEPPSTRPSPQHAASDDCQDCLEIETLRPGMSLVGKRIAVRTDETRTMIVSILRIDGAVVIDVDGKRYGIRNNPLAPGVRVGEAIGNVESRNGGFSIMADDYGDADVATKEAVRVLEALSDANDPAVTLAVEHRFNPQPNSALAAAVGLKRYFSGWTAGDFETCDVTFERLMPATDIAMAK